MWVFLRNVQARSGLTLTSALPAELVWHWRTEALLEDGVIMSDQKKCLRCGGTNVVPSELQSTGKMYARPKHAKLSTILTTGVLIRGDVCIDCGHLELTVDAAQIKSALKAS